MLNESDVMRRKVRVLGKTVPPRQDDLKDLEHFLCVLYGDKESLSVNQTRYNMYCKSQSLQSHQLSPTESALLLLMAESLSSKHTEAKLNGCSCFSVHTSSYGCTREFWRALEKRNSCTRSSREQL